MALTAATKSIGKICLSTRTPAEERPSNATGDFGILEAELRMRRSQTKKFPPTSNDMHENGDNDKIFRILMLIIAVMLCIGCGMPQPNPLPISYQTPQPSSGVFSLAGSVMQYSTVKTALSRCDFPFERLKPGLRQAGLNIPISRLGNLRPKSGQSCFKGQKPISVFKSHKP